jgi:hypothetical protein
MTKNFSKLLKVVKSYLLVLNRAKIIKNQSREMPSRKRVRESDRESEKLFEKAIPPRHYFQKK